MDQRVEGTSKSWFTVTRGKAFSVLNRRALRMEEEALSRADAKRITRTVELCHAAHVYGAEHRFKSAFEGYTSQQKAAIDAELDKAPALTERERKVLSLMLEAAERDNVEILMEGFLLKQAFCSDYAVKRNLKCLEPLEYVLGVREMVDKDFPTPWDLQDEKVFKEAFALIRYAYELQFRMIADVEPHTGIDYSQKYQMLARNYEEKPLLKELVREYPERTEELIDLSLRYETSDAVLLRSLIEHDGPTAMASGWL